MERKLEAWTLAAELVKPIIEQHTLKQTSPGSSMFATGNTVITPVDQHIEHIIGVAEWLMEPE